MIRIFKSVLKESLFKLLHPHVLLKGSINAPLSVETYQANGGTIEIGNGVTFQKGVRLSAPGGKIVIGEKTTINRNNMIICREEVRVGKECAFGPNVLIYDHDHRFDSNGFAWDEFRTSSVIIEDGCWVGANAIILRGTHIGKGSVIGACSVVKGIIPPHSLVTANRDLQIQPIEKRDDN